MESPLPAFARYLMTQRLNIHYADVNAAGSYFVLTLFIAIGLTLVPKGRAWFLSVVLVGSSAWIAGSRLAMMTGLLAILLPAGARAMRIRRGGVRGTTLAVAALVLALLSATPRISSPSAGISSRRSPPCRSDGSLPRRAFGWRRRRPLFGVGMGRYYSRSGEFSSPELLRMFPPAIHENAHNNFLQLLAELGMVGLRRSSGCS